jgi:hypothetical protein
MARGHGGLFSSLFTVIPVCSYFLVVYTRTKQSVSDDGVGGKAIDLVWPFVHYERSKAVRSVRLFPFYWSHSDSRPNATSFKVVFPLYFSLSLLSDKDAEFGDDNVDHPKRIAQKVTLLFPYCLSWTNEKGQTRTLGSLAFLPPYYYSFSASTSDQDSDRVSTLHVWPLYGIVSSFLHYFFFLTVVIKDTVSKEITNGGMLVREVLCYASLTHVLYIYWIWG